LCIDFLEFTDLKFPTTVANIAVVKPDKARKIEDMLIMNAQRGAFGGQISQLIQMLETITEKTKSSTKVCCHIIIYVHFPFSFLHSIKVARLSLI
jgi:hypothetical protein